MADSNTHELDSSFLPSDFMTLLSNCSHSQKKVMLIAIRNSLNSDMTNNQSATINFSQYVDRAKIFVREDYLDDALFVEVTSMGIGPLQKLSSTPHTVVKL